MSKVTVTQEKEEFRPVTVSIRLDTKHELDALYCVFSHSGVIHFLDENKVCGNSIYQQLSHFNCNYSELFEEFLKAIK